MTVGRTVLALLGPLLAVAGGTADEAAKEAFSQPTAALMWPGATRSFLVTPLGGLDNGEWVTQFHCSANKLRADSMTAIRYSSQSLPVASWSLHGGDIMWKFEGVAFPGRSLTSLAVTVKIRATNLGSRSCDAEFRASIEALPRVGGFVAPDVDPSVSHPYTLVASSRSTLVAGWCGGRGRVAASTFQWRLAPGQSESLRVIVPSYLTSRRQLSEWARVPHERRVSEAIEMWSKLLDGGMQLTLGDPDVEGAYRSALVVLLGCTQRDGDRLVPLGNPFQYRDVWLRDGARCITALAVAGQTATSRALAAGLLDYQWPQGPFLSHRGQLDGNGQALWAFEQALLRPGPSDSVARFASAALSAWRWSEGERATTTILGLPFSGLMPYCEPRDNELQNGRAQLIGTDAWSIAGYRATARLLLATGRPTEAAQVERSRRAYLATFQSMLRSLPVTDIPPSWQLVGKDWGNLSVAFPCEALPPSDLRCQTVAERVWRESPEPGLVRYGGGDSVHTYLSADLATWALLVGRREDADRVLSALLRWRTASGGSPEIFDLSRRDFGANYPPHATAAAAIVTLIRNMVVFDDDDTLRLTLGARSKWWAHGGVQHAPTRWGLLDLRFRVSGDSAAWTWTPVPVPTSLTLPPGTSLADSQRVQALSAHQILAPPYASEMRVRLSARQNGAP
jgi:hypothetical protein